MLKIRKDRHESREISFFVDQIYLFCIRRTRKIKKSKKNDWFSFHFSYYLFNVFNLGIFLTFFKMFVDFTSWVFWYSFLQMIRTVFFIYLVVRVLLSELGWFKDLVFYNSEKPQSLKSLFTPGSIQFLVISKES